MEDGIDKRLLKMLKKELNVGENDIYHINGPLDLTFLMKVNGMKGFDHLKYKKYVPAPVPALNTDEDIFTQIRNHDIILSHPYQTFDPVVDFVRQARCRVHKLRKAFVDEQEGVAASPVVGGRIGVLHRRRLPAVFHE